MRLRPLPDQTIVVTGASSGIGLAVAQRAVRAGARVFLIARNGPALEAICAALTSEGAEAAYAVADVGDEAELAAAAEAAVARFGGFDTWINAAGVAIYAPLLHTPRDEHERLFRTDYWGVVNGSTLAVAHLRERGGGALITVGSVVSDFGTPILGAYAAAKHAVKGFVDSLRIELIAAGAPVSVTLIKPSGIASPLGDHAANHLPGAAKVPPPAYDPDLVAQAVLHAAEHRRREITVGGVGRLQTLLATHAPWFADRISPLITPLLSDRSRRQPPETNLFGPGDGGRVRTDRQWGRPFSLYTAAQLHPGAALAVGVLGGLAAVAVTLSRPSPTPRPRAGRSRGRRR